MSLFSPSFVFGRGVFLIVCVGLVVGTVGCDGGGSSSGDPPAAPTGVEASAQDGVVVLEWEQSAGASEYNVYRDTDSTSEGGGSPVNGDAPVKETSFTDASVENGTLYYYRVTAVGDGGESDPTSEVRIRPFPAPPDDRP